MALMSLGRYREALLEFSVSAVLDEDSCKFEPRVSEALQRLLIAYGESEPVVAPQTKPLPHSDAWGSSSMSRGLRSYLTTFIGSNKLKHEGDYDDYDDDDDDDEDDDGDYDDNDDDDNYDDDDDDDNDDDDSCRLRHGRRHHRLSRRGLVLQV